MFTQNIETDISFDFLEFSEETFEESYNAAFENKAVKEEQKTNKLVRDEVSQAFYKLYH